MHNPDNDEKHEWVSQPVAIAKAHEKRSRSVLSSMLVACYRFSHLRSLCLNLCEKLEAGPFYSASLRDILWRYHKVKLGRYSYGAIVWPGVLPRGTIVGAYCSVGSNLMVRRRNHPTHRLTQHPFFYNKNLGYLVRDTIETNEENPLTIGHDVWIGDRVTILPGCKSVGNGAVLAAGAVVTRDVEPYSIVAGVPAKKIKMRFDNRVIKALERSRWWEMSAAELLEKKDVLLGKISQEVISRLNRSAANQDAPEVM